MRLAWLILLSGALFLTGCLAGQEPADEPALVYERATAVPPITVTPSVTMTAVPSPTATDTATPTAAPTDTPTSTPTIVTPAFTPTSTPTIVTPAFTPTPTPTVAPPSATPTATVDPIYACRPAAPAELQVGLPPAPWPRPGASDQIIRHGVTGQRRIALTFDVEGHASVLEGVLAALDKHGVKTTMFILGSWAEQNGHWVAEIARRGHEFANHGYSHRDMRQLTAEEIYIELERTETLLQELTGQSTRPWARPPYGAHNEETVQAIYNAGWTTVLWTGSAGDHLPEATEESMCQALVRSSTSGSILLAHTARDGISQATDRFIGEMRARGYTFVPLSLIVE